MTRSLFSASNGSRHGTRAAAFMTRSLFSASNGSRHYTRAAAFMTRSLLSASNGSRHDTGATLMRRSFSSAATWRCDLSNILIEPESAREKFKTLEHHTLYADMSKKDANVVFVGHLYSPSKDFMGEFRGTLEFHKDTTNLEMRSSLMSATHFASQKCYALENLLVVTDSREAFNHLTGTTNVKKSKKSNKGRYKKRRRNLANLEGMLMNLAFGFVTEENDKAMARVDGAAKEFRESFE